MAEAVLMPKQGQSVETCIITEWFKQKGDTVTEGDLLFAYETDKASFEEEAKTNGTLLDVFYKAGDEVPVLVNIAVIGNEGDDVSSFKTSAVNSSTTADVAAQEIKVQEESVANVPMPEQASKGAEGDEVFVSPRARKLAKEKGVPVAQLKGSGPSGRVIEQDVLAYIAKYGEATPLAKAMMKEEPLAPSSAGTGLGGRIASNDLVAGSGVMGGDFEDKPLPNIRKLIAKAMHASLQNSAQLTHHLGADARQLLAMRNKVKAAQIDGYLSNITLNDMICYATIRALKQFPNVNSHFLGDSMRLFKNVHLGLAVDTDRGLMVPAIRNASDLSIQGLSKQMNEIAAACRKGSIDPELLNSQAATFTVSNLGNYGVEMFTPIINLPQSAILGVNTIVPRPKDLGNGAYGFVPYLGLSLTYDHRSIDGGEATRFVKQVAIEIENIDFEL